MIVSALMTALLGAVLIGSGILKLRTPGTLQEWASLGVPRILLQEWLLRLHPWVEILLGVALASLGGEVRLVASVAALLLLGAYTGLLWKAWRAGASCGCFGAAKPVAGVQIWRNLWLVVLAVGSTIAGLTLPRLGGGLRYLATESWPMLLAIAAAAITVVLIIWDDVPEVEELPQPGIETTDELDYIPLRTPNVPITRADGTVGTLRNLVWGTPTLVLALTEGCGSCHGIYEQVPAIRELLPRVDVRLLLQHAPDVSGYTEHEEPQSLHDPDFYVGGSFDVWGSPAAFLIGRDGLLAGGPVAGQSQIEEFVRDIRAELEEAGYV